MDDSERKDEQDKGDLWKLHIPLWYFYENGELGKLFEEQFGYAGGLFVYGGLTMVMCIFVLFLAIPLAVVGAASPVFGILSVLVLLAVAMRAFGMDVEFGIKVGFGSVLTTLGLLLLLFWSHGEISLRWSVLVGSPGVFLLYSYF